MAITPVNFNETTPRYTTVEAVKGRLAIPPADVTKDAAIQAAIVAAELAIDIFMERALPDTDDPPDSPAVITIVPDAISQSALQTAIAVYKEADAPTGTAGSDAFFGTISVSDTTRRMIERNPALVGFRVRFGVA